MSYYSSFAAVIEAWPSVGEYGEDIGVDSMHARALKYRDSIPPEYWLRTEAGAAKRGIDGVDIKLLAEIAEKKKNPVKAIKKRPKRKAPVTEEIRERN